MSRYSMRDKPLPEDAAIAAAFPTLTGRHDIYAEAMRLVGAKHSKAALVALVNWLLLERANARRGALGELRGYAEQHAFCIVAMVGHEPTEDELEDYEEPALAAYESYVDIAEYCRALRSGLASCAH